MPRVDQGRGGEDLLHRARLVDVGGGAGGEEGLVGGGQRRAGVEGRVVGHREDLAGVEFKLSDYRGKVVFLDFWGHW